MMTDDLDRLPTEQTNARTAGLDLLDSFSILQRLNDEDSRVPAAVRRALPEIARAVDVAADRWRRGGRVVLFGAGTSGRLATLDAAEVGPTFGVPPERYLARMAGGADAMQQAAEGSEDDYAGGEAAASDLAPDDVAFGIAASGRTPWVLGALEMARRRGAATIAFACVPAPSIARSADIAIVVDTGPEAVSGSTRLKAGTAQKLVLNSFSTTLMIRLGKVYGNLMVDVRVTNEKLRRRAARLVAQIAGAELHRAELALAEAGNDVKLAALALCLEIPMDEARVLLESNGRNLRRALDSR